MVLMTMPTMSVPQTKPSTRHSQRQARTRQRRGAEGTPQYHLDTYKVEKKKKGHPL